MNELKDVVTGAEDLVHDATRSASREYAVARRNIQGALDDAMSRLDDARRSVAVSARDAADATDGYVRRNPWEALGVAAAAGFVIGFLLRKR